MSPKNSQGFATGPKRSGGEAFCLCADHQTVDEPQQGAENP